MRLLLAVALFGALAIASRAEDQGLFEVEAADVDEVADKPKGKSKGKAVAKEDHTKYSVRPVIVENHEEPHADSVKASDDKIVINAPSTKVIDDFIKQKEDTIHELNKKLEESVRHRVSLRLAEDLYKGVVGLKKTREHVKAVEAKIAKTKKKIAKFGERAAEVAESVKHNEAERKREMAESNAQLSTIQKQLKDVQAKLGQLTSKRAKFAENVDKWKHYVAVLRDAYERSSVSPADKAKAAAEAAKKPAAPPKKPSEDDIPAVLPEPPSASQYGSHQTLRGAALKKEVKAAQAIVAQEVAAFEKAAADPKHHSSAKEEAEKVPAHVAPSEEHHEEHKKEEHKKAKKSKKEKKHHEAAAGSQHRFASADMDIESELQAAERDSDLNAEADEMVRLAAEDEANAASASE